MSVLLPLGAVGALALAGTARERGGSGARKPASPPRFDLDALIAKTRPAEPPPAPRASRPRRAAAGEPDVRAILALAEHAGDFHHVEKQAWLKAARGLLVRLAEELEFPKGSYEIHKMEGGPAVSGDVSLTAPGLYVSVNGHGLWNDRSGSILVRGADAADRYGTRYTNIWPGRDWASVVVTARNTLRRPMKDRGHLNRQVSRTVAWRSLPYDMQVLLGQMAEDWYGREEGTWVRDLVVRPVPIAPLVRNLYLDEGDRGTPHVEQLAARFRELLPRAADRRDPAAVMAAMLAPDPRHGGEASIPPIVTKHGRFADGRHRMFAARQVGITHLPAVELDEWIGPEGSAARSPETPAMIRLREIAERSAAKLRTAGTPEGARHAKWEWDFFRRRRQDEIEKRRSRAYEQVKKPSWEDWRALVAGEPYLYHFTHYGQLRGISREGLRAWQEDACVYLTTPGGFPEWAGWAAQEAAFRFDLPETAPSRFLVVLRVRRDRLDAAKMRLDMGGTHDARFYPGHLRWDAPQEAAVAVCYAQTIPPEWLEVARVRGKADPRRTGRRHVERLVIEGPWVPVARLAKTAAGSTNGTAADVLPIGTVLFHGARVPRPGVRLPEMLTTAAEDWLIHEHPRRSVYRYETTKVPTRVLVAQSYDEAYRRLGGNPRVAATRREVIRRGRIAGLDAIVVRWPQLESMDVILFARDLLGPGVRVYPGIPRITAPAKRA